MGWVYRLEIFINPLIGSGGVYLFMIVIKLFLLDTRKNLLVSLGARTLGVFALGMVSEAPKTITQVMGQSGRKVLRVHPQ